MPRVRQQGGNRSGNPGTRYPNRTDLANQPSLPARTATDQTYGKAQSSLEAQRTIPMAPPRLALPSSTQGGAPVQPSFPAPGAPPSLPAPPPIAPGAFGDLHRPTERPFEPVTAGINSGPGPGPEALNLPPPQISAESRVSDLLSSAAAKLGSPLLSNLAARAAQTGQ